MKIVTIAALPLAAALALLPLQAAVARPAGAEIHVSYADLNLRSEAGLRTLDRRLSQAARIACSDPSAEAQLARQLSVKRCIAETGKALAAQRDRVIAARAPTALAERGR
jgi:UrcA family protein